MIQQLKLFFYFVIAVLPLTIVISCNRIQSGDRLSKSELEYIKGLGLLDSNENIILFETHSGRMFKSYETSGNFISDKRLASYWIDENNSRETIIDFAYYDNIDTLTAKDLSHDWTLASYIIVKKKNRQEFKLFIGGSSSEITDFFKQANNEWTSNKKNNGI